MFFTGDKSIPFGIVGGSTTGSDIFRIQVKESVLKMHKQLGTG